MEQPHLRLYSCDNYDACCVLVQASSFAPTQLLPKIITAFCLPAGGVLYVAAGHDSIAELHMNKIGGAMTVFTAAMGLAAVVLSSEVVVFAPKM